MDKETIKNKIKKLLALSADNPSEAESLSALSKAQELMALYKISDKEVSEEEEKRECIKKITEFKFSSNSSDHYISDLADIIAENFCCISYLTRYWGEKSRYIAFMGYEEDVDLAIQAMTVAHRAIYLGYNQVYKEICKEYDVASIPARLFNPKKVGYVKGYLKGLKELFEAQRQEHQEWGLVLVPPQEATDFRGGLDTWYCNFSKSDTMSSTYYNKGVEDGRSFSMNSQVEGE